MPFCLVPTIPGPRAGATVGARRNVFLGSEEESGWQAMSLGQWGGQKWGLLWSPTITPSDPRVRVLCDGPDDTLSATVRTALTQFCDGTRSFDAATPFRAIVGSLMTDPPPGRWRALRPGRTGIRRVLLGPGGPGRNTLWSEQTAFRATRHSQDIQDTFNRANGAISGSTSSDAQFTWSLAQGSSARWNIVSNQAVSTRTGSDMFIVGLPSLDMDTDAHYGQWDCVTLGWINTLVSCGIACRIINGTGTSDGGHSFEIQRTASASGGALIYDWSDGTPLTSDSTYRASGTLYLSFDADGAYTCNVNGTPIFTGTDDTYAGYLNVCPNTYVSGSNSATIVADNFRAADLGGAGTPGAVFSYHYKMQGIA